jgi:hypothetical protein
MRLKKLKNIWKEIKPFLNKFVKASDNMEDKNKIFNELEKLKADSGFRVPKGYFDTLSSRISDKVSSKGTVELSPRSWMSFLKPHLALVAFFTGVAFISYFGFHFLNNKKSLEPLSNEIITEFISYYYSGVNEYELFDVTDDLLPDAWPEEYDITEDEELIDYLMYQEVDVSSIINEL